MIRTGVANNAAPTRTMLVRNKDDGMPQDFRVFVHRILDLVGLAPIDLQSWTDLSAAPAILEES
jgi:hypothetical protein